MLKLVEAVQILYPHLTLIAIAHDSPIGPVPAWEGVTILTRNPVLNELEAWMAKFMPLDGVLHSSDPTFGKIVWRVQMTTVHSENQIDTRTDFLLGQQL